MVEETSAAGRSYAEVVWDRHSNPKSGWSRLLSWPVFILAVYFRKRRLMAATMLFGVLNPLLFREPDETTDDWMYRVVQAEKRWTEDGNRLIGLEYPQVLNTLGLCAMLAGLYGAYRQRLRLTITGTIVGLGLNQVCMKAILDYYEKQDTG